MVDNVVSASALLSELADAYQKCNLTADSMAQLLSTRASVTHQQQQQTEEDELSILESAEAAALGAALQGAHAAARHGPSASHAAASAASSSSPASGVPSASLFRCRTYAEKRQVLALARCDLTQTNLSNGPVGFWRTTDDLCSPASSGGCPSPATTATGNPRFAWHPPPPPNQQHLQHLELSRRGSLDYLPPPRRNSGASQPLATPAAAPQPLQSTPPPILLRERLLQRYDSNPGTCYQSCDDDPLLSPTVSEILAWRLSERGQSPRVTGGDGTGGSGSGGGGGGGASGRISSNSTPLVPTLTPPAGRALSRGVVFSRSRRTAAGNACGMAPSRLPFDGGRSSRQSSSSGVALAHPRGSSLGSPTGSAAVGASSSAASGGIGVCGGGGGGGGFLSCGHSSPQLQLLHSADADFSLALLLPAATPTPSLPAMPAPRRSFQGIASGSGLGSGPGRDLFPRSSSSRVSTSEWL